MVLTNGYHDHGISQEPALLQNGQGKEWVVQKFGGTSVGRFAENIVEGIVRLVSRSHYTDPNTGLTHFWKAECQSESHCCDMLCAQQ
jgi:hypothetical protein